LYNATAPTFVPGGACLAAGAGGNTSPAQGSSSIKLDANSDLRAAIGAKEFVPSFGGAAAGRGMAAVGAGLRGMAVSPMVHLPLPPGALPSGPPRPPAPAPAPAPSPPLATARAASSAGSAKDLDQDLDGFDTYDNDVGDDEEILLGAEVP
jgi:hypothetical protein